MALGHWLTDSFAEDEGEGVSLSASLEAAISGSRGRRWEPGLRSGLLRAELEGS